MSRSRAQEQGSPGETRENRNELEAGAEAERTYPLVLAAVNGRKIEFRQGSLKNTGPETWAHMLFRACCRGCCRSCA